MIDSDIFEVLRCVVALSYADGHSCEEERGFIRELMQEQNLSTEQMHILEKELESPANAVEIFVGIEQAKNRGWALYLARLLFFKDGDFSKEEQVLLESFQKHHSGTIDLNSIVKEALQSSALLREKMDERDGDFDDALGTFLTSR